jgi:hypothetical protein
VVSNQKLCCRSVIEVLSVVLDLFSGMTGGSCPGAISGMKKVSEPIGRKLGVTNGMLDVSVAEIVLD